MSTKQWVQHISGTGEKWEIIEESEWEFEVRSTKPRVSVGTHYLPKSEYRLCKPPEVWRDVSEGLRDTSVAENGSEFSLRETGRWAIKAQIEYGYRLRKVQLHDKPEISSAFNDPDRTPTIRSIPTWAFIVEQKVSE